MKKHTKTHVKIEASPVYLEIDVTCRCCVDEACGLTAHREAFVEIPETPPPESP